MTKLQGFFFKDFKNSYIPQILDEIYIKQVYTPYLLGKKDLTIADWGGNIGLTSYYFKDYAKMVYCVEPSKEHHEAINQLIKYNKISNIKLCPYAIANKNGEEKFYHNKNVTMFSLESIVNDKEDYEEVNTVDPETFMIREGIEHIDLLKFDCEGSESSILTSKGFEIIAPKIDVIVGEWHNWTAMSREMFRNTFTDLGFDFKWLSNTDASVYTAIHL